jgi:glycosyltransferase involved in cell wall biosynthesis
MSPAPHAVVCSTTHPPGDVRVFSRLACGLAARGWRVSLVLPQFGGDPPPLSPGVELHPIAHLKGYKARITRSVPAVMRQLGRLDPDLAIFIDPELMPALLRWQARTGRPAVFDRHEHFERVGDTGTLSTLGRFLTFCYASYERRCARRLAGVIVVLEDMRSALPGANVLVAHNYPPRSALDALGQPPDPTTEHYTFVQLGTMDVLRGFLDTLELARVLVCERGRDVRFLLGGHWQAGLLDQARSFAAQHRLEHHLTLVEHYLPHAQVVAHLRASSIGLATYPDNPLARSLLMNKLAEYMAAGLPLVAGPSSNSARIVEASGGGVLLWSNQVREIADVVERWLDNPDEARAIGARGQAWVREHLTWEAEFDRLDPWLRGLLRR